MDGGESAGAGTLLGLGCAGAGRALWARQDAAGGDDYDMAVGELLFELAGEAGGLIVSWWNWVDFRARHHTAAGSCGSLGGEELARR